MAIESLPPVPQGSVPMNGTDSVQRALATPEPSLIQPTPIPSTTKTDRTLDPAIDIEQELNEAIKTLDIMMEIRQRSVQFERDETSGTNIIRVIDDRTGEVIRQMPPDELLNFMRNLTKMLGNFLDEKV
jgi:flagellar protein FlaG